MSKLAVVDNVNGAFKVESEWTDNEQGALVAFHDRCKNLWNAPDTIKATVKILDEDLNIFEGKVEVVSHAVEE